MRASAPFIVMVLLHITHTTVCMDASDRAGGANGPVDKQRWAVLAFMSPDTTNTAFDDAGKFCSALDTALTLNIPPQNIIVLANPGFKLLDECKRWPYNLQQALKQSRHEGTPVHVVTSGLTVPLWVDVVAGNTEALPNGVPGVAHDASFLMLYIGAHGVTPAGIDADAEIHSLDNYLTNGLMAFFRPLNKVTPVDVPAKSLLHETGFPRIPKLSNGANNMNRALTSKVINWVLNRLQTREHKPTVVAFITSCYSAALFNNVATRIDKQLEQASVPKSLILAEKKRQLFEASPIPNTVVFTNALDYMPSSGSEFDEALTRILKAGETRTWKDVLTALKKAQVKNKKAEAVKQVEALEQEVPDKMHRLNQPAPWRLRAFGDATVFDKPIGDRKTYDRTLFKSLTVFHISDATLHVSRLHPENEIDPGSMFGSRSKIDYGSIPD